MAILEFHFFPHTIDATDAYLLAKCRRWQAVKKPKSVTFYIRGCEGAAEPTVYLHRLIMGASEEMTVSHKDGDGLNNVRSNLVVATRSVSAAHAVNVLRRSDFKLAGEPIENKVITDFPLGPTINSPLDRALMAFRYRQLPRAFGHSADTRILQFAVLRPKYLILLVGAHLGLAD